MVLLLGLVQTPEAPAQQDTVVASGSVVSHWGIKFPTRTGPQALLDQPPDMAPARRQALCDAGCERLDRPVYTVPVEKNPRLGFDQPTGREVRIAGIGSGSAPSATAQTGGDFLLWRTSNVNVTFPPPPPPPLAPPGQSSTNEPSLGVNADVIFATGNWYAALSPDLGLSWLFMNPFDNFPADGTYETPGTSSGFCCDQVVYYERSRDLMVWLVQYSTPRDSSGNRTATNVQRLAWAVGRQNLLNNNWSWVDFTVADFGLAANMFWLDFPDLQVSDNNLYYTTNVFPLNGGIPDIGVIVRIPLDPMRDGGAFNFSYLVANSGMRMCSGCTDTLYFGRHVDTDTIRIFRYPENSGTIFYDDVDHVAYGTGMMIATSPDGTNWAGFSDNRILAAYRSDDELGFMYGATQKPGFPYPYVDVSKFKESDRSYRVTEPMYSTQFGVLYPSLHLNARGDKGGTLAVGGGTRYPGVAAYIVDEFTGFHFDGLTIVPVASGGAGPGSNRWGDYLTSRQSWLEPNSWVASGFIMPTAATVQPLNVWFSRERDTPPGEITVRSVTVQGGACHSSGSSMTVTVELRNLGMTARTVPLVQCRISADADIDVNDTLFASTTDVFVDADSRVSVDLTATVPDLPNGLYRVGAWLPFFLDPVVENNERVSATVVGIGPPPAPAPVIVIQPQDVAVCPGTPVNDFVFTRSYFPPSYFWIRNGLPYSFSTTQENLVIANPLRSDSGVYRLDAQNQCGTTSSNEIIVAIGVFIRQQPQNRSAPPCGDASFSLQAHGVGTLNYQWRHKGAALVDDGRITGVHSSTVRISGARYDDEGSYDCVVTDACGPVTSNAATLTLPTPTWVARNEITRPGQRNWTATAYDENRRVLVLFGGYGPGTAEFGSGYYGDHWEYDGVEWVRRFLTGIPTARYNHVMTYDSDRKRVVLFGGSGNVAPFNHTDLLEFDGTAWSVLKSGNDPDSPPYYSGQQLLFTYDRIRKKILMVRGNAPGNSNDSETWEYAVGDNAWTKRVAANGFPSGYLNHMVFDPALGVTVLYWTFVPENRQTWRWDGNVWTKDAVTTPHLLDAELAFDATRKRCVLFQWYNQNTYPTESWYYAGSDWVPMLPSGPPSSPPIDLYAVGMSYDTQRRAMVAAFRDYDTIPLDVPFDIYEYRYLDRVMFDRQPEHSPLVPGLNTSFTAFAAGYGSLTYQWRLNGQAIANGPSPGGGTFGGATTPTLTIDNLGEADAGVYSCFVSNTCGGEVSRAARLGRLPQDLDGDGHVEMTDFALFQVCFTGAGLGPPAPGCGQADLDHDVDVDDSDFAIFHRCFGGAEVPVNLDCAVL